jgi:hypothetical protein
MIIILFLLFVSFRRSWKLGRLDEFESFGVFWIERSLYRSGRGVIL